MSKLSDSVHSVSRLPVTMSSTGNIGAFDFSIFLVEKGNLSVVTPFPRARQASERIKNLRMGNSRKPEKSGFLI